MRYVSFSILFCLLQFTLAYGSESNRSLKVLQFNIWSEGTAVENGFNAIIDNIIAVNPDMVTLSEVRNYNDIDFISHLISKLKERGFIFYGESSISTGVISRYPIIEQTVLYPYKNDQGSVLKSIIEVEKRTIALYSAHLDYKNYACYLPRGYSGSTWKKLNEPVSNPDLILAANRKSYRVEAVNKIIADAKKEIHKGHIVIIGGDFNEPSHLDWQENTKNLWDHNGVVVEWDCSKMLHENNFLDTYRKLHPDAVNYPGFTFPSDNPDAPISKLTWAPEADERERIDFIYYHPNENITLKDVLIVGPSTSIVRSNRKEEKSKDRFILPSGIWPTDHKAVLAIFDLQ